jgi:hypothetical protein
MRYRQAYAAPPRVEVKAPNVTGKKRKLDPENGESSTDIAAKKAKKETKSVPKKTKKKKDALAEDDSESVAEDGPGRASSDSEEDEDEPFDPSTIVHESLQKSKEKSRKPVSKKKYVPPDETPEQRDFRTVFVGNLSVEVVKKRVRILNTSSTVALANPLFIAPSKTTTQASFVFSANRQNRIHSVPFGPIQRPHSRPHSRSRRKVV